MKIDREKKAALRRKYHVRKKIFGTPERPRLSVFRSSRHIYAQVIDDVAGVTLVSASTRVKTLRDQLKGSGNKEAAKVVGETVAKQALSVGIKCICFDRNRYKFHGRVKTLADAKAMKFRIAEAAVQNSLYKVWGLNAVAMPWPDVAISVKQETLDHKMGQLAVAPLIERLGQLGR